MNIAKIINSVKGFKPFVTKYRLPTLETLKSIEDLTVCLWNRQLRMMPPSNFHRRHLTVLDNASPELRAEIIGRTQPEILASLVISNIIQWESWQQIETFKDVDIHYISKDLLMTVCKHCSLMGRGHLTELIMLKLLASGNIEYMEHCCPIATPMIYNSPTFIKWDLAGFPDINHEYMTDLVEDNDNDNLMKWEYEWKSYVDLVELLREVEVNRLCNNTMI